MQHRAEVRRLARRVHRSRADLSDPIHQEHKTMRNSYGTMIENLKRAHWEAFLQNIDERTIWTAHRYVSGEPSDGAKARVPTLKVEDGSGMVRAAISSDEKSRAF